MKYFSQMQISLHVVGLNETFAYLDAVTLLLSVSVII